MQTLKSKRAKGFTLLEVLLVVLLIGMMARIVVPSVSWGGDEERLQQSAERFKAVFDLASEFAMLNNTELGVIFKDNNYRFVSFDGTKWVDFSPEQYFEPSDLEEGVELELELEGLEWAEHNLLSEVTFEVEEDDDNDSKEMLSPQVFILSSGDITPFRLTFSYKPDFADTIYFQVSGEFTTPVTLTGPLDGLP